nr:MAG TPA: hypothetical protein [Caudoviricetes sp.]
MHSREVAERRRGLEWPGLMWASQSITILRQSGCMRQTTPVRCT